MYYVVDGSNLLGRLIGTVQDDSAKRELMSKLSAISRAKKGRVLCFFDGPAPASFATRLGSVEIRFTGSRSADDEIASVVAAAAQPLTVVTSDQGLAARVSGRKTKILDPRAFLALAPEGESAAEATDWEGYFSDANNRNV